MKVPSAMGLPDREVLIVGRTRMGNGVCVGALDIKDWSSLRLAPPAVGPSLNFKLSNRWPWLKLAPVEAFRGWSPYAMYHVGDLWTVSGKPVRDCSPPHVEDFVISRARRTGEYGPGLKKHLETNAHPVSGGPEDLFAGTLRQIPSHSLCARRDAVPEWSTQFWNPRSVLTYTPPYYWTEGCRIKYVGCADPVARIPTGSLVRVSLSRWYQPDGHEDSACFLQLSGWWL